MKLVSLMKRVKLKRVASVLAVAAIPVLALFSLDFVDQSPPETVSSANRIVLDPKYPNVKAPAAQAPVVKGVAVRKAKPRRPVTFNSVDRLDKTFRKFGYDLQSIGNGGAEVPRLLLASMPGDMEYIPQAADKKELFFKSLLPLILKVNEDIITDRRRIRVLYYRGPFHWSQADRKWLKNIAKRYNAQRDNLVDLLKRVDVIPPSLALVQAANESAWGTSRFARLGNAIFGQWTYDGPGIIPNNRPAGKTHKVKSFGNLLESVRGYVLNLNSHRAYTNLRQIRYQLRRNEQPLNGAALAAGLLKYSERGQVYVDSLRRMIRVNNLSPFDRARLSQNEATVISARADT